MIGDAIEGTVSLIICGVSCTVGIGCSVLAIGIAQIVLNPITGFVLILVSCRCVSGAFTLYRQNTKPRKKKGDQQSTALNYAQQPMQQPMQSPYEGAQMTQQMVQPQM